MLTYRKTRHRTNSIMPTVALRPFTVAEYHRMAEVGIFAPDERVELLDGQIIPMSPIGSQHAAHVRRLQELFSAFRSTELRYAISVQNPIRLGQHSEPEPDIALLRPRADYYAEAHPTAADVYLVVEVADSSLAYDQQQKVPRYAAAGIAEVWVLDVLAARLTVYRQPGAAGYGQQFAPAADDPLTLAALPLTLRAGQVWEA